jgi:hypothetical protein
MDGVKQPRGGARTRPPGRAKDGARQVLGVREHAAELGQLARARVVVEQVLMEPLDAIVGNGQHVLELLTDETGRIDGLG